MKSFAEAAPLEKKRENIEKILEEAKFEIDLRYFVLINGIFDKNIYRNIRNITGFIKYVKLFLSYYFIIFFINKIMQI